MKVSLFQSSDVPKNPRLKPYVLRYSDGTVCFTLFPASIAPELLEDLLNDALHEEELCSQD